MHENPTCIQLEERSVFPLPLSNLQALYEHNVKHLQALNEIKS